MPAVKLAAHCNCEMDDFSKSYIDLPNQVELFSVLSDFIILMLVTVFYKPII